ncbi:MAG: phosphoribosylformylglycinamidine cyclo-ligase [Spirochaetota bacterium]
MATYREAGVDTGEAARLVERIREHAGPRQGTDNSGQGRGRGRGGGRGRGRGGGRSEIGAFGAVYELPQAPGTFLVSSTDGVGTKIEPTLTAGRYRTVGRDCVAMCANDILCHGARPLYFLDYLACGRLDADVAAEIVAGMTDALSEIDCDLAGGETAEMPGMYAPGVYDVAGFIVGMVDAQRIIDGSRVRAGDALVGIGSNGVHANGFSLIRALKLDWEAEVAGRPLGELLLEPTVLYVNPVLSTLETLGPAAVHGIAHITGGGLPGNVPRMARGTFRYRIDPRSMPRPAVFDAVAAAGVTEKEMYHTFNMGIGMVLAVPPESGVSVCRHLRGFDLQAEILGTVTEGEGVCIE